MLLETRATGPFFKNGFVVGCERTREAVLIDPGDDVDQLLSAAERQSATIRHILLTHAHLDHVTGVAAAKRALNVPVWLHRDDNFLYERVVEQGRMFGISVEPQPSVDRFYEGEGPLRFGRYAVRVLHTPGHCPGGVCLAVSRDGDAAATLFVGDTLFAGSIGRTDLPLSNPDAMDVSLALVAGFDPETAVYPGHGPGTRLAVELATNPFLIGVNHAS